MLSSLEIPSKHTKAIKAEQQRLATEQRIAGAREAASRSIERELYEMMEREGTRVLTDTGDSQAAQPGGSEDAQCAPDETGELVTSLHFLPIARQHVCTPYRISRLRLRYLRCS